MNLAEFNIVTYQDKDFYYRPQIVCNDGFKMSVQGSRTHYCSPRENNISYSRMEVGYPTEIEPLLLDRAEDKDNPTDTVYGYVDCDIIQSVIDKHNGINIEETFKNTKS